MDSIDNAIAAFRRGEFVMVMDRLERENECDLILAAEHCTPEKMAFMIHWSTGIVCVVSNQQRLEEAGLYPATTGGNTDKNGTNFYVSTDFLPGTTTGVSAADRSATVRALCDSKLIKPENFSKPGHMFPLCAKPNGLWERDGHTEAAYDLCRLAGIEKVSIIGEMMHQDGTMMRLDACKAFAAQHGNIPLITVPQLKEYAERMLPFIPPLVKHHSVSLVSSCKIKVDKINDADCTLSVFKASSSEIEIVVLSRGDITQNHPIPLRIHSECFTGDILGSLRCDCGDQLDMYMSSVMKENSPSLLVYVRGHEGRGIGLANKIECYRLQDDEKLDTVEANLRLGFDVDLRSFAPCWEALEVLFAQQGNSDNWKVNLYTNNPDKISHARVARVVALSSVPNGVNNNYLLTKQVRLKHKTCIDTMKWEELLTVRSDGVLSSPERTGRETKRVSIVAAKWNDEYVSTMVDACVKELGSDPAVEIERVYVPGAFDLIAGAKTVASRSTGAIICIGVLIKGETDSYDHTCAAVSASLAHLNTKDGVPPIISGLLMYKNEQQANERLSDETAGKLGISWARSALTMMKQT